MSNEELKNVVAACPNFYGKLFQSTFLISAFTVGGGFVIIPLLRAKYVDEYGWLSDKETLNLVSIAQSMPGVVAVNASIILGYRMAGIPGALTALAATILPGSLAAVRRKVGVIKLLAGTGVAGLVLGIIQRTL
ncbi:chromate transporter [Selenomonas ruminantium]|uniref:chromate transporter n=1 Tax=Selenomonas ruminantium TaxID=971 RepID=UPI0026EF25E8|nr:chromate transporter [Selenomonas ruminantium]